MVSCELPELLTDDLPTASTDACIDFIKDERGCRIRTGKDGFEREHEARGLTAGGDLCQWFEGFAEVGSDEELYPINAGDIAGIALLRLFVVADRGNIFIG